MTIARKDYRVSIAMHLRIADHGFFIVEQHGGERAVDNAQTSRNFCVTEAREKKAEGKIRSVILTGN